MKQLFLTSSADLVLDSIVPLLEHKPSSYKVAFINTAAEVEEGNHWWVTNDKNKLLSLGFIVDEFSVTGMASTQLISRMEDKQIIFVCGGNVFYLLDQFIKTGCDKIITDKVAAGVIYIGTSAGSMVVGKNIDIASTQDDRSKASGLKSTGPGIVDIDILPHWGSLDFEEEYQTGFSTMYREDTKIIPLTNNQFMYVNGDNLKFIDVG